MPAFLRRFLRHADGATAIEYTLIGGAMATIVVALFAALDTDITETFTLIGAAIRGA